ncbi:MAG: hypothetical protein WEE67_02440 [Chloroflexota bacterium]
MAEVVTLVTGNIAPERAHEVADSYREALRDGPPPDIEETFLLRTDDGRVGILSVWHRRADLDAMLASGEEPFARRLIRGAGGTPEVTIFKIVHRATSGPRP